MGEGLCNKYKDLQRGCHQCPIFETEKTNCSNVIDFDQAMADAEFSQNVSAKLALMTYLHGFISDQ